jgi:hypothetical protein
MGTPPFGGTAVLVWLQPLDFNIAHSDKTYERLPQIGDLFTMLTVR